jgi:hypothetical protein
MAPARALTQRRHADSVCRKHMGNAARMNRCGPLHDFVHVAVFVAISQSRLDHPAKSRLVLRLYFWIEPARMALYYSR